MSGAGVSRNRPYHPNVSCCVFKKVIYSDYEEKHANNQHKGQKVTFSNIK